MKDNWQKRTELLIGIEKQKKLTASHVLVVGLGGVGSYAAEQLVRAGIGKLTIVDGDTVHSSNRNRQLPALVSTLGIAKTEVMAQRMRDINPDLELIVVNHYIKDQSLIDLVEKPYDYVIDAIDTLTPKVNLIYIAHHFGLPVVSSMGAGGKSDPRMIQVVDISETNNCRLAYYIRKKLHKMDVWSGITAVYSPELVSSQSVIAERGELNKRSAVGTISYMPAMFGCYCASIVINKLLNETNTTTEVIPLP
ncbi:MAG: tRNA threonylcarbamoyladenosine dehydratase [Bacteroidetes bacterium HGW-Bacteroidetes-1]|jgi:tRNA A37 threonylcarbamoyladenosine dehydratase|nr:MAG: tRNA threonylcarbamoyladenosine dehydratase [Bacteroidetes bacterium HGW-Bacteroidetes-1]